jgi:hypothetical protein
MAGKTASPLEVTREQVLAFRRRRQNLHQPARGEEALTRVLEACPVQNTPPGAADVALHARIARLSPDAMEEALLAKTLVQAWSLRGTPHVLPAGDLAVYTVGLAPADEDEARYLLRPIMSDLDAAGLPAQEAIERTAAAIGEVLDGQGGRDGESTRSARSDKGDLEGACSKDDLLEALARRLPAGLNPWCARCRMHHVHPALQRAAGLGGGFLLAPRRGNETHFVRTDRWLGAAPAAGNEAAGPELVRRYLRAYGPSTAAGFATWAGISPRGARRLWQAVEGELVAVNAAGGKAWVLAADGGELAGAGARVGGGDRKGAGGDDRAGGEGVRLLPPNDPYLVQPDREALVPDRARRGEVWRAAGAPGVLLVDGEVAGTWRSRKAGRRLEVTVRPFAPLSVSARRRTAALADGLGAFRESEGVALTWSTEGPA